MRHQWKAIAACLAGLILVTPAAADDDDRRDPFKKARKRQKEYEKRIREAQKRQAEWAREQQKRAEEQHREALKRQRESERDRREWVEERFEDRDDPWRGWYGGTALPPAPYSQPGYRYPMPSSYPGTYSYPGGQSWSPGLQPHYPRVPQTGGYAIPLYPPAGTIYPGQYPPAPYGYGRPPTIFPLAPALPPVYRPYYFRDDDDDDDDDDD